MSEEHKQRTREMIAVMQAYVDGQQIEAKLTNGEKWGLCFKPSWDFRFVDYRIATTPDSIDWSHVAPEHKYMARDSGGSAWLFDVKPVLRSSCWAADRYNRANIFTSYRRGTVDWEDSLVERPE